MNTERTSATEFMTNEIHIDFEQFFLPLSGVPQAIIVGRVTHWNPAYVKALRMALGIFLNPTALKSALMTVNSVLLLKMPMV